MKCFLINLCSDFNPDSLLPWFMPYTSQGNLPLFEELMLKPVPEKLQEFDVYEKINTLVKYIRNRSLSSETVSEAYEIGFVLGYDPWLFTHCKGLSQLPVFKVMFLRNKLIQLLGNEFANFELTYFVLGIKSNPIHLSIDSIEKKGYCSEHLNEENSGVKFEWFSKSGIRELVENTNKTELAQALISKFYAVLSSHCPNSNEIFSEDQLSQFLDLKGKEANEKITDFGVFLKEKFSLNHNLLKNEFEIRYVIDNTNLNVNLISSGKIAIFLMEYYNHDFRTSIFKNCRRISINDIELDHDQLNYIVNKLNSILAGSDTLGSGNMSSENFSYKVYNLPADDQTSQFPLLDSLDENNFCNHDNIKNAIGYFYTSGKYNIISTLLNEKKIEFLENKVFSFKDDIFLSPVYSNLTHTVEEKPLNEIGSELNNKKASLKELQSEIDYEEYFRIKQELLTQINERRRTLVTRLFLLPGLLASFVIMSISFFIVLVFGLPLYSLNNGISSFIFSTAYLLLDAVVFIILLAAFRQKITTLLTMLESIHHDMFNELRKLELSMRQVAKDLRLSYIARKNIGELENCIRTFRIKEMKKKKHLEFFDELRRKLAELATVNNISEENHTPIYALKTLDIPPILNEGFALKPNKENTVIKIVFKDNRQPSYEVVMEFECRISRMELITNNI